MVKKKAVTFYIDEHLPKYVDEVLKEYGHRPVRVVASKFRGRDEHDFFLELNAEGAVFVTGDERFCHHLEAANLKSAPPVIFMHQALDEDTRAYFAGLIAYYVKLVAKKSIRPLRGEIYYPGPDGIRYKSKGKDRLLVSWDALEILVN